MSSEGFAPLLADSWLTELTKLASWCEYARGDVDDRAIRRAFHLAVLAPLPIRNISSPQITLDELEEILETGTLEAAALAVVGNDASIDLIEARDGFTWFASFGLANDEPAYSSAPTAVRALIAAWASYYCQFSEPLASPIETSSDIRSRQTDPMPHARREAMLYYVSV